MSRAFALTKRHADIVLVPSASTLEDCVSHGVDADRLCVVPWGVTAGLVSERDRSEVRTRYRLPSQYLLWVGTAEPRKNLKSLISAVAQSETSLPLILVGPSGWGVDLNELMAGSTDCRYSGYRFIDYWFNYRCAPPRAGSERRSQSSL